MPDIAKQNFLNRWFQESKYGTMAGREGKLFSPDIIVSANAPIAGRKQISQYCNLVFFKLGRILGGHRIPLKTLVVGV